MSNDQPNSSPATVDWVKTCVNDAKDDINDQTQKAIDKAVSSVKESVDKDLGSVKESLKEATRSFATRDLVRPYITWVPRLLYGAIAAATVAICTLGSWVGRLHGFW